ncbi:MAG: recombinase family protein [Clostridiales bacterium]|nr:recombinase family protein [Clostridiales bacterium]
MILLFIVKELSRLARNSELAQRIKRLTENNRIQIISLDGQVDTFNADKNENFGLFAWMYEAEALRTSRRIKAVYKKKQLDGNFLGSIPPYGFLLEEKKLIPRDDETIEVIKIIYTKFLEGWGQDKIARHLSGLGYPTPAQVVKKKNAGIYWHGSSVKKILTNAAYIGHLVQNCETSISITNKKRVKIPKEEQVWVYNTHKALIDETTFNLVQQKIEGKKRNGTFKRYLDTRHLFTNFLYCADCGAPLWYKQSVEGYLCGVHIKHGNNGCSSHNIREAHLISIIKKDLKSLFKIDLEKFKIESKSENAEKNSSRQIELLERKIQNMTKKNKAYLDKLIDEIITDEAYKEYVKINNEEIEQLKCKLAELKTLSENKKPDLSSIKSDLAKIINLEVIDRELLNLLIDHIEVKDNGELKVFYTFASPILEYNYKNLKSI